MEKIYLTKFLSLFPFEVFPDNVSYQYRILEMDISVNLVMKFMAT